MITAMHNCIPAIHKQSLKLFTDSKKPREITYSTKLNSIIMVDFSSQSKEFAQPNINTLLRDGGRPMASYCAQGVSKSHLPAKRVTHLVFAGHVPLGGGQGGHGPLFAKQVVFKLQ